ncbi:hypothetical protein DPMN_143702 [Dreissena polymorpha]|uniref:Uncharacterized protein n=1 Tax=Dreissena polymorpha TaxID=45954 RepID=A0A9D4JK95_DREPO|nr:hypothetical protein DPMN_143702 [Dreissena polymorpha]
MQRTLKPLRPSRPMHPKEVYCLSLGPNASFVSKEGAFAMRCTPRRSDLADL